VTKAKHSPNQSLNKKKTWNDIHVACF